MANKSKAVREEEGGKALRLSQARDIVTEMARYILVVEKDPIKREDLYFRLIESLDFSDEWVRLASGRTLGALYDDLANGWWGDLPKSKTKEGIWSEDEQMECSDSVDVYNGSEGDG